MADILEYKCPCCGGAIQFDSGIQKMKCPYCDTEFEMETLLNLDAALNEEKPDSLSWDTPDAQNDTFSEQDGVRVYVCKSCGGEIVTDTTTSASMCPYCGNPVVMAEQVAGTLRPDCVIPFQLDKEAAKKKFAEHLCGKKFLPKVFKDENHIDEIKGVYVPFWLYDADADAQLRFRGTSVADRLPPLLRGHDPLGNVFLQLFPNGGLVKHLGFRKSAQVSVELLRDLAERQRYFRRRQDIEQDEVQGDIPVREALCFPRLV